MKDSCYYTEKNLKIAEGLYRLCDEKGWSITQALIGFIAVQEIPHDAPGGGQQQGAA